MTFEQCDNCGKPTGHRRAFGWGTFFAVVLTAGLWLLTLPFYPSRCIVCGSGTARRRSPLLAAVLSGLFPGLGQLYNRERLKALLFVIGGVVTAVPFSLVDVDINLDNPAAVMRMVLLASLPFLIVALWSVIDAYRTARRPMEG
jgi:hypothetical protein